MLKKLPSLEMTGLLCAFASLFSVGLSYVLGGIHFLDYFSLLLFPAFAILLWILASRIETETKDYAASVTLIAAAVIFALVSKYRFEVGLLDDNYHNLKIVSAALKNNFMSKIAFSDQTPRIFFYEYIELVWGVLWRIIQRDYIIVIVQAMPIFLLWQQLVRFFRLRGVTSIPAFLSTVTILNLQIIWSQLGSTYIDSIAGCLIAGVLLGCYDLFHDKSRRTFFPLLCLAGLSAMVALTKDVYLGVALFGISAAITLAWQHLNYKKALLIALIFMPALIFFIYYHYQVWLLKGDPFFPGVINGKMQFASGFNGIYSYLYKCNPLCVWIHDHWGDFRPAFLVGSWLMDYRLNTGVTAAPDLGGNGLLWTYIVVPSLFLAPLINIKKALQPNTWRNPSLILVAVIAIYYLFFDPSIDPRFMLGFNVFILAWCLSWIWKWLESNGSGIRRKITIPLIAILLLAATLSYFRAIRGDQLNLKFFSVLSAQQKLYPQAIQPRELQNELMRRGLRP